MNRIVFTGLCALLSIIAVGKVIADVEKWKQCHGLCAFDIILTILTIGNFIASFFNS